MDQSPWSVLKQLCMIKLANAKNKELIPPGWSANPSWSVAGIGPNFGVGQFGRARRVSNSRPGSGRDCVNAGVVDGTVRAYGTPAFPIFG